MHVVLALSACPTNMSDVGGLDHSVYLAERATVRIKYCEKCSSPAICKLPPKGQTNDAVGSHLLYRHLLACLAKAARHASDSECKAVGSALKALTQLWDTHTKNMPESAPTQLLHTSAQVVTGF